MAEGRELVEYLIRELATEPDQHVELTAPTYPPSIETDFLLEAELLRVEHLSVLSSMALIFDSRGTLDPNFGNTLVVVVKRVHGYAWSGPPTATPSGARAWHVLGFTVERQAQGWLLEFLLLPEFNLRVSGAEVYVMHGTVPELTGPQLDYPDSSRRQVEEGTARWESQMHVHGIAALRGDDAV